MEHAPLLIRPLATIDEYRAVHDVHRAAWNTADPTDLVPLHVLITAQKNGGLVAAAFAPDGHMIGFVFGFIGQSGSGRFKHCSHMMGVRPEARTGGVGYQLKLFQRRYVQKQGFDLITWTYDPLEPRNARLNIAKLGAVTRTYYFNHYGEWLDGIHRGLPTDRFEVEWWINSDHVRERVEVGYVARTWDDVRHAPRVLTAAADLTAPPIPAPLPGDAPMVLIEIPADFQAVKAASLEAARAWRRETAHTFSELFGRGYALTDFMSVGEGPNRHNYYVAECDLAWLPAQS